MNGCDLFGVPDEKETERENGHQVGGGIFDAGMDVSSGFTCHSNHNGYGGSKDDLEEDNSSNDEYVDRDEEYGDYGFTRAEELMLLA